MAPLDTAATVLQVASWCTPHGRADTPRPMIRSHAPRARAAVALLACVAVATIAACSDAAAPDVSPVGEYALHSRAGEEVPLLIYTGDSLLSASLTIRDDASFDMYPMYRHGAADPWTTHITGTWSRDGSSIQYMSTSSDVIATGSITQNSVTFVQDATYEFRRVPGFVAMKGI